MLTLLAAIVTLSNPYGSVSVDTVGARHRYILEKCLADCQLLTCPQAPVLRRTVGRDAFKLVNFFEICDYARPPCAKERAFLARIRGFHWTDGK